MTAAAATATLAPLVVLVPMKTVSESNQRGSWRKHQRRHQEQRWLFGIQTQAQIPTVAMSERMASGRWCVTMTRVAPRRLDQGNNPSSMKHAQDGFCDALGINDGDPRIEWEYLQRKPRKGEPRYAVEVTIEPKGAT